MPNAATYTIDGYTINTSDPARGAFAITPHDSVNMTHVSRAIYVGGLGNIAVVMANGDTVTFSAVPAGTILPIQASRVNATNTTATLLIGLV